MGHVVLVMSTCCLIVDIRVLMHTLCVLFRPLDSDNNINFQFLLMPVADLQLGINFPCCLSHLQVNFISIAFSCFYDHYGISCMEVHLPGILCSCRMLLHVLRVTTTGFALFIEYATIVVDVFSILVTYILGTIVKKGYCIYTAVVR